MWSTQNHFLAIWMTELDSCVVQIFTCKFSWHLKNDRPGKCNLPDKFISLLFFYKFWHYIEIRYGETSFDSHGLQVGYFQFVMLMKFITLRAVISITAPCSNESLWIEDNRPLYSQLAINFKVPLSNFHQMIK